LPKHKFLVPDGVEKVIAEELESVQGLRAELSKYEKQKMENKIVIVDF
jgi:hypothetical protein